MVYSPQSTRFYAVLLYSTRLASILLISLITGLSNVTMYSLVLTPRSVVIALLVGAIIHPNFRSIALIQFFSFVLSTINKQIQDII